MEQHFIGCAIGSALAIPAPLEPYCLKPQLFEGTLDSHAQAGIVEPRDLVRADLDAGVGAQMPHADLAEPQRAQARLTVFDLPKLGFGHRVAMRNA